MSSTITLTESTVSAIGRADIKKERTAESVVSHPANVDRDWTARGAVPAAILAAMGLEEHPTAQKKGKKGEQVETAYGRGFRVLADAVRAIVKEQKETVPAMRVSLTGVGSAVVPADHPAYPLLLALLEGESGE